MICDDAAVTQNAKRLEPDVRRRSLRGELLLVALTVLWGTSFVAIKAARSGMSAGSLVCIRFAIATLLLSPFFRRGWKLWLSGVELGVWLWAGYLTQAQGLLYTSAGRGAFVTSLNVIFVPMLAVVAGRRIGAIIWIGAALALGGAALLCYDGSPANRGDLWILACALLFAVFIVRLESAAQQFNALPLTAVQLLTVTLLSAPWLLRDIAAGPFSIHWPGILYLAIACTAITTLMQTVGQRDVPAAQASIIYMLEPVFASIWAYIQLNERMGWRGFTGSGLILAATLLTQIPMLRRKAAPVPTSPVSY